MIVLPTFAAIALLLIGTGIIRSARRACRWLRYRYAVARNLPVPPDGQRLEGPEMRAWVAIEQGQDQTVPEPAHDHGRRLR